MKKSLTLIAVLSFSQAWSQADSSLIRRVPADTGKMKMNMDAIYNRPFLTTDKLPVSLGGYLEANTSYFGTDGVTEGLSFQLPRLTVFISSTIKSRIRFLSEIEFEEGGREINIEFASMDVEVNPLLNFRGGVVMNPIGAFNQNHDGPRWEFISRPISATSIIPSTWSNVGFGIYGKYAVKKFIWAYELYLTNGFDESIISGSANRTWLPASKANTERFEESFNGIPLVTAKTALRRRGLGELGLSWMGGVYNKFEDDGLVIDKKRRVDLFAIDFNSTFPSSGTYLNGEFVVAVIDVPGSYSQAIGNRQFGGFLDIVQPVWRMRVMGWEKSVINIALRTEFVDYNHGHFNETGGDIGDEVFALVPGISFRPSQQTVIRFNYRRHWQKDLLGNPPSNTAAFQFGFSTYF